jgi:hypothetical protein
MRALFFRALVLLLVPVLVPTGGVSGVSAQDVLPRANPPFKGTIGPTYRESKPDFPKPLAAPAGAPNGETHPYYPVLYRNTSPVPPPRTPAQGYHVSNLPWYFSR